MGSYAVKDTLTIKEVTLSAAKARSTYTFLKSGGGSAFCTPGFYVHESCTYRASAGMELKGGNR